MLEGVAPAVTAASLTGLFLYPQYCDALLALIDNAVWNTFTVTVLEKLL